MDKEAQGFRPGPRRVYMWWMMLAAPVDYASDTMRWMTGRAPVRYASDLTSGVFCRSHSNSPEKGIITPPPCDKGLHSSTFQLNLSRFGHTSLPPCLIDWGKLMHPTYPTKYAYVEPESGRV